MSSKLSKPTSLFGLQLWLMIFICIVIFILLILLFLSLYICFYNRHKKPHNAHIRLAKPIISKDISSTFSSPSPEIEMNIGKPEEHQVMISSDQLSDFEYRLLIKDMRQGTMFTLREIEAATNGLAHDNVIGKGKYWVVYGGVLFNGTLVAVKKLQHNSFQAEVFRKEAQAIGQVRHKNLVKLIGYCIEGAYRILVYEHVFNRNLHMWLHDSIGHISPLTWSIRMNIILGTAKGLAYLHEDIEPKVVHQDLKSRNILLDLQWSPKISDFGLATLFSPKESHVTTCAMMKSDVYSFGILIMEIISGRPPIDYSKPQGEEHLIDWLKSMVSSQKSNQVLDPKIPDWPSSKELKRVLLIALRCVDPDVKSRPKMGDVVHMLQPGDLLLSSELGNRRETCRHNYQQESQDVSKFSEGHFETSEGESREEIATRK